MGIALIIVFVLLLLVFIFCAFRLGAKADYYYNQNTEGENVKGYMKATCEKCNKWFMFEEKDALIKYKYGTKYIVHCPYCDKLAKVNID